MIQEEIESKDFDQSNENTSTLYKGRNNSNFNRKYRNNSKIFLNTKDGEGSSKAFDKRKIKCFHCKKHGHLIKDCRKKIAEEKTSPRKQSNIVTKVHKLYVATLLVKDELYSS